MDITKRALKNPTLKLIIFCYSRNPARFKRKFREYKNVDIVYSNSSNINFKEFSEILNNVLPQGKDAIQKVEIVNPTDDE